ncbi:hypothetical protein FAGKG844_300038 [Frankia sp. AgKG'84/4]
MRVPEAASAGRSSPRPSRMRWICPPKYSYAVQPPTVVSRINADSMAASTRTRRSNGPRSRWASTPTGRASGGWPPPAGPGSGRPAWLPGLPRADGAARGVSPADAAPAAALTAGGLLACARRPVPARGERRSVRGSSGGRGGASVTVSPSQAAAKSHRSWNDQVARQHSGALAAADPFDYSTYPYRMARTRHRPVTAGTVGHHPRHAMRPRQRAPPEQKADGAPAATLHQAGAAR